MTQDQLNEILEEVRRTMDEMVALTERKVVDLVRTVDEAYRARVDALDDVIARMQQGRSDKRLPPLN
jgi:hypothetical protein